MTVKTRFIIISIAFALVTQPIQAVRAMGTSDGKDLRYKVEPLSDMLISPTGIAVPLERILLVRADTCYCAIKFTKAYTEETGGEYSGEYFATYESWYQGDGTGDFSKSNVKFTKRDLWWKLPIGIGRLWLIIRERNDIECGPITLRWSAQTAIFWTPKKMGERVQTIHFAPTPWVSISEVNVRDPRIVWYYQRPDLPELRIPIDQLWKVDLKKERELQERVDKGHQPWRLDAVSVAHAAVVAVDRTVKFEDCNVTCYSKPEADVLCKGIKEYVVKLMKFVRQTQDGIWTAVSIEVNQ